MAFDNDGILVVDLDGTLLRSDMLFETFWSAFGQNSRAPFRAAAALAGGRAALKRALAAGADIDAANLPYDADVIAYVQAWRAGGGRTALVTASDRSVAEAIGRHLGLFDEIHGSDGTSNLKGEVKGRFLEERFGARNFAYMGDSSADVAVWRRAAKAITVNATSALRRQAEEISPDVEHIGMAERPVLPYFTALRPHQWLKNVLVFLPMLAAHRFDAETFFLSLLAFVSFSLTASGVYLLNDLLDLAADRHHPRKRTRPFASGAVPLAHGTAMAGLLGLAGTIAAAFVGWQFLATLACYIVLTTAYSLHLKKRVVIDICVLAGLYTARIVAGGIATETMLSVWLLAFAIFFFLSLAAVKRQAELVDAEKRGQLTTAGRGYHTDDLPIMQMIAICAGYVAVLVLTLYINSPAVAALYARPEALWAVAAVMIYWITRTVLVAHRGKMHDDPVVYAAKDRISQLCLLLVCLSVLAGTIS